MSTAYMHGFVYACNCACNILQLSTAAILRAYIKHERLPRLSALSVFLFQFASLQAYYQVSITF